MIYLTVHCECMLYWAGFLNVVVLDDTHGGGMSSMHRSVVVSRIAISTHVTTIPSEASRGFSCYTYPKWGVTRILVLHLSQVRRHADSRVTTIPSVASRRFLLSLPTVFSVNCDVCDMFKWVVSRTLWGLHERLFCSMHDSAMRLYSESCYDTCCAEFQVAVFLCRSNLSCGKGRCPMSDIRLKIIGNCN